MKSLASQMAAASMLFALLGPPLGALMINIYFLWPLTRPIGEYFSGGMVLISLMSVVVGYLVGILPAAIAGAAYAYSVHRIARIRRVRLPVVILVGGRVGFISTLAPLGIYFGLAGKTTVGLLWPSIIGAGASCLCALSLHAVGALPNCSFKPKPLRGSA